MSDVGTIRSTVDLRALGRLGALTRAVAGAVGLRGRVPAALGTCALPLPRLAARALAPRVAFRVLLSPPIRFLSLRGAIASL
ncbi:hypothetical protein HS125_18910 [bacterium]|nr:hypothetical protein [bacterium]